MKKNIIDFDEFMNPNKNIEFYKNKNLDINDVHLCSYIKFLIIEHNNGEVCDNYFVLNDLCDCDIFKNKLCELYFGPYIIYAVNCLDNIVCEVI